MPVVNNACVITRRTDAQSAKGWGTPQSACEFCRNGRTFMMPGVTNALRMFTMLPVLSFSSSVHTTRSGDARNPGRVSSAFAALRDLPNE